MWELDGQPALEVYDRWTDGLLQRCLARQESVLQAKGATCLRFKGIDYNEPVPPLPHYLVPPQISLPALEDPFSPL